MSAVAVASASAVIAANNARDSCCSQFNCTIVNETMANCVCYIPEPTGKLWVLILGMSILSYLLLSLAAWELNPVKWFKRK